MSVLRQDIYVIVMSVQVSYLLTFLGSSGEGGGGGGDDLPLRIFVGGHCVRQQFSHYFVLFEGF